MLTSIYGFYYPSAEQYDETCGQTAVDIKYEVKIEEIENVVVEFSGRALAAQARGVLDRFPVTAGLFTFLYLFQHEVRVLREIVDVRKTLKECEGGSWLKLSG